MADVDPFAPEAFKKPPNEVTRFFSEKKLQPSFHWQDVMLDEHAHAFTVAKSAGYDILGDVRGALQKAIEGRQDFDEFRKGLEPMLKAKGWWGKAQQIDPLTGKPKQVQLGSVRRLQTIYWANVNTAYAAGEWERTWRTRRVLPYVEYLISTALHKREEHLAWVGTILEVEDPWWDTHWPPNGWLCQCRIAQISEEEAQGRPHFGKKPEDFGSAIFTNKRTGEISRVPIGIDPGWNNNPGKFRMRNAADFIAGKLDAMDDELRRIASADLAGSSLFRHIASGGVKFDPTSTDPEMVARGDISLPFAALPADKAAAAGSTSRVLRLSVRDAARIGAAPEAYGLAQSILDRGKQIAKSVEAKIGGLWRRLTMRVEKDGAAAYLDGLEMEE